MSDELLFLPWVRRGVGALLAGAAAPSGPRPAFSAQVRLSSGALSSAVPFEMYGPGDALGFAAARIVRSEPAPNSEGFTPSWMPFVEFDQADFPWLLSPLGANDRQQLTPWLTLIALEESEVELQGRSLEVASVASLPDLATAWAWAHVQITGATATERAQIGSFLEQHPERCVARLVCARRLRPGTRYVAAIVPTFAAGVEAGLGQAVKSAASKLAWDRASTGAIRLPSYHQFRFRTGIASDFEDLVRKLRARPIAAAQGNRALSTARTGYRLPSATLQMQGALRPNDKSPAAAKTFEAPLAKLLNREPALEQPSVAPPIYGNAFPAQPTIPSAATAQAAWLRELNLDPRHRLAASIGVDLVKKRQESLMAAAWAQYGEIERANQLIRQAQLAEQSNERVFRRLEAVARTAPSALLALVRPVLNVVMWNATGRALASSLGASPAVRAALSPALQRLLRPRGPLARRLLPAQSPARRALDDALAGAQFVERGRSTQPDGQPWAGTLRPTVAARQLGGVLAAPLTAPSSTTSRAVVVTPADLGAMGRAVLDRLAPAAAMARVVKARVKVPPGLPARGELELVRAAPSFGAPVYKWLCEEDKRWLAPGVDALPDNSVTALVPNPVFIEALLIGMNHEMARELLFRGFPADGRGTSFRQFWETWDRSGMPARLKPDLVAAIRDWDSASKLGAHLGAEARTALTVLLVRGEALRACPEVVVSCVAAKLSGGKRSFDPTGAKKLPLFTATLPPDTALLAFDEPAAALVGSGTNPGFFFVFEQPPSGLHLGLDAPGAGAAPASWSDLAWSHVGAADEGAFASVATAVTPSPGAAGTRRWGPDAHAGMIASLLLKKPIRVAIHAASLLVPEASGA